MTRRIHKWSFSFLIGGIFLCLAAVSYATTYSFGAGGGGGGGTTITAGAGDLSACTQTGASLNCTVGNFTLGSDASAGGFELSSLGAPDATGDALSEGNPIGATTPAPGTFTLITFATVHNQCQGTSGALSAGAGTITNGCITSAMKPYSCNDTSGANLFIVTPGSGSAAITGGTNGDVIWCAFGL